MPGFLIEPYYFLYSNRYNSVDNRAQGLGTAKHSNQTRHIRRKPDRDAKGQLRFDATKRLAVRQMGDNNDAAIGRVNGNQKNLSHQRLGHQKLDRLHALQSAWKPRLAFNFDYASGDGRANCTFTRIHDPCKTANTFENMFPTNHIHMGYMDVQAWKNMMSPSVNFQAPSEQG